MAFICALSQQTPSEPVVSTLSGCVFEKSLIERYIDQYRIDPITREPLTGDQLVEIKHFKKTVTPKLPSNTSVPGLLGDLRDEWDALMLDSYQLKDDLLKTKRELSHALYQLEASYRVIARLKLQVDELQVKLRQENEPDVNGADDE